MNNDYDFSSEEQDRWDKWEEHLNLEQVPLAPLRRLILLLFQSLNLCEWSFCLSFVFHGGQQVLLG